MRETLGQLWNFTSAMGFYFRREFRLCHAVSFGCVVPWISAVIYLYLLGVKVSSALTRSFLKCIWSKKYFYVFFAYALFTKWRVKFQRSAAICFSYSDVFYRLNIRCVVSGSTPTGSKRFAFLGKSSQNAAELCKRQQKRHAFRPI